jgi:hypothetical protein
VTEEEEEVSVEDPEEGNNGETSESEETGSETETVTEEEEEVSVEDPEEGNNGETSESEETDPPEEEMVTEEEEIPDPVQPSPAWLAVHREIEAFGGGTWTPEDQQTLADMESAHIGNGCVFDVRRAACQDLSGSETNALRSLRACPVGWSFSYVTTSLEALCFHPLHEDYDQRTAYHDPSEASTEVIYPPY